MDGILSGINLNKKKSQNYTACDLIDAYLLEKKINNQQ